MKTFNQRSLVTLKSLMVILNMIIVIFYGSLILLSTRYIIHQDLARSFLNTIDHLPRHPLFVFLGSFALFVILALMIDYRFSFIQDHQKYHIYYSFLEILVCFFIIYILNMSYNGLLLLVFCDCIYYLKGGKYTKIVIVVLIGLYLVTNYDIFSNFVSMTNINHYMDVYSSSQRGVLMLTKTVLETSNILLFIAFIISYLAIQIQENENITKELNMIHQVNEELKNYAAVTEKIGENNERKRLAREIHDTLGHALTGIAAGIDACIATIDINPSMTKDQLVVISKVVRQGIGDVRNSLNKLRPGALEQHGLQGAIEQMINEMKEVSDMTIDFRYQLHDIDFDKTKEDIIFRIIQESITNAMRHGGAHHMDIDILQDHHKVMIIIQDDGKGCQEIHFGYGLKQMQERVMMINGTVHFDGRHGFKTTVELPMQRGEYHDESRHC